jgi:hypothetical protein
MMKNLVLILLIVLAFFEAFPTHVAAWVRVSQALKKEKTKRRDSPSGIARQEFLARLNGLLHSTAHDSKKWGDPVAAARVQAQVADLTWDADSVMARAHLLQAWETTKSIKEEVEQSAYINESKRAETRREVMLIARRRAPEVASTWLADMAGEAEASHRGEGRRAVFDDRTERSAVLLRMAAETVKENPQVAADLAVESLRDGISFGLQSVLLSLQAKDFESARKVFRAATARLRANGITDPGELLILYSYLYTPGQVIGANQAEQEGSFSLSLSRDQSVMVIPATLDPGMALAFLNLAADILLRSPMPSTTTDPQTTARAQITAIQVVIGEIAKQFPEKATMLKARLENIARDAQFKPAPPGAESNAGMNVVAGSGQDIVEQYVSSLEEKAKKETDSLARDQIYATAALAARAENYERSLRLAQNIGDKALRLNLRCVIRYRAALHFAMTGKLEKAYEINAENDDPLQRASCLVVGAQKLSKAGKTLIADQWLREATELVKKTEDMESAARIVLGVAAAYIDFDTASALDALSLGVKFINSSSALPLEGRAPYTQRFSGLPFGDFTYATAGFGMGSVISASKSEEFDRILAILNNITSAERRGLAIVLLCRQHLGAAGKANA